MYISTVVEATTQGHEGGVKGVYEDWVVADGSQTVCC